MNNVVSSLLFLSLLIAVSPLAAITCPAGSLTSVTGSPFTTGVSAMNPFWIAYSPLINGNLFAATTNISSNSLAVWQANTMTGLFSEIAPFPLGSPDIGTNPSSVAYSPIFNGQIYVAVANNGSNSISLFSSDPITGVLTPVSGSPFTGIAAPFAVAYSPILNNALYLAVTNINNNKVSVYTINPITGALSTQVTGSPFTTGDVPNNISFSPPLANGNQFVIVNGSGNNNIVVYQVNIATGAFDLIQTVPVPTGIGRVAYSPAVNNNLFVAATDFGNLVYVYSVNTTTGLLSLIGSFTVINGQEAYGVAFSPVIDGQLYAAVGNYDGTEVSMYNVNTSTGVFTRITGPFTAGTDPASVAFSPLVSGGLFLAAANYGSNNVSVFGVTTLTPTITTPSFYTSKGTVVTINATVGGGTPPFTIVWNDGFTQTVNGTSVSRMVTGFITSIYYMLTVTDSNSCVAGPSNQITIGVLP
jgi:6-phosphogluconolactonase (cycloisomerase 2 family)